MTNTVPTFLPTSGGNAVPCYQVAGPLQVWVDTGASHAVEFLGFTRGGAEIQEQSFQSELKSDYTGGEQGPPGDYEWLGEMHTISLELALFVPTILAKCERRMEVAVTNRTRGTLVSCAGGSYKLLLLSLNFSRLYTRVFIPEPITYAPIGSPASFPRITFTALDDPANTDLSPYTATGWTVSGAGVTIP